MEEYLKQRADELKEMVEAELSRTKESAFRLIESFLSNTLSTYKANEEPSFFEKIQQNLDGIDNGWGKAGTKLGHDSITDHVVDKSFKGLEWDKLTKDWPNATPSKKHVAQMYANSVKPVEKKWEDMTSSEKHQHTAIGMAKNLKPVDRWKPEVGEKYWVVKDEGEIDDYTWANDKLDISRFNFGNIFRTESEAIAARERVKKALSGTTPSDNKFAIFEGKVVEVIKYGGKPAYIMGFEPLPPITAPPLFATREEAEKALLL